MLLYDSRIYSCSLKNQTLYFSFAEVGKCIHLKQSINQLSNQLKFIKYLLNSHHRLITVLRIGCTEINGKQYLLSRSNPRINNKEQSTKSCKELLKHMRIRRRIMKMMTREVNLEKRVGSLYNRTHGVFWKYQDILLDLREKIGKK